MPAEFIIDDGYRRRLRTREADLLIARLAEEQDGVVGRGQLVAEGIGRRAIDRRIAAAHLHVLYAGVYAVGRRQVTRRGRWRAAVLAGGVGAVLSHLSAAFLWGLLRPTDEALHVTTPRRLRSRPGLRLHTAALPADEVTIRDGIPVTTVARTLLDLAAIVPLERLDRAMNEAEVRRLGSPVPTRELMARHPRRRGARNLRAVLAAGELGQRTRSDLEERFRVFVRGSALPSPELNAAVELNGRWYEVDALWRRQRVAVELDGWRFHWTPRAWARDRARARALRAAGFALAPVTWHDLDPDPSALEAELAALLGQVG